MKSALKLVGYIIAFLLMAAGLVAIVLYIMGLGSNDFDIITTMPPVITADPDELHATPTPSPQPTPTPFIEVTPSPTPSPTPTPEPTPSPTPTPNPAGKHLGSDTLTSDTGVYLNIDAIWNAVTASADTAEVTVLVNLRSFSLNTPARKGALVIKLNDQEVVLDVEQMVIDTDVEKTTQMGSHTFTVYAPPGQNTILDLQVSWNFNGTYSGRNIEFVEAKGFVTLIR